MPRSGRRGFLGALTALPALMGLGKRAVSAEPEEFVGSLELFERTPDPRKMTTVILEWSDRTRENVSVLRPVEAVLYAPRFLPQGPTIEKVEFRFSGRSIITDLTDDGKTIPIYEEVVEHVLFNRVDGGAICRDCGLSGARGTPFWRFPCLPGPAQNVRYLKEEL